MKWIKIVVSGIIFWTAGLIWPEISQFFVSPVILVICAALGVATPAYFLGQYVGRTTIGPMSRSYSPPALHRLQWRQLRGFQPTLPFRRVETKNHHIQLTLPNVPTIN